MRIWYTFQLLLTQKIYNIIKGYDVTQDSYIDELDFIKNASRKQLEKVYGIGHKKAEIIFKSRHKPNFLELDEVKDLHNKLLGYLGVNRNHFTLDHFIPQSSCCLFARSLYNFVPSCYTCNSKFKKKHLFSDRVNELYKYCPTYKDYDSSGNLEFSLIQKQTVNIFDYSKVERKKFLENFNLKVESQNSDNRIVSILHLRQRYSLYKDKAVKLAYLKEKYSEKRIEEIAQILSDSGNITTADEIRNDIFHSPVHENEALSKLHKDIMKQVGII